MTVANERLLKVGKRDGFGLNVSSWANGEAVVSFTATPEIGAGLTVDSSGIDGGTLEIIATGTAVGSHKVIFEYATATRTDCETMIITVINACS